MTKQDKGRYFDPGRYNALSGSAQLAKQMAAGLILRAGMGSGEAA